MPSQSRKNVIKRIARIHGHLHGIMEMLEEERSYSEVLQQISAVKAGLDSAVQAIVEDLIDESLTKIGKEKSASKVALELKEIVARSR